ncbi:hypothetical protein TNCT_385291 [Trichonephila clavata]|uniref:Uncharacterized protein n=1 Tax=Trichonephila clavata TaxID=2740835 RepID=A0A8X6IFC5_TRICU|nr:hypothetical protein TNCT_385291 [Trichonephila clavata]
MEIRSLQREKLKMGKLEHLGYLDVVIWDDAIRITDYIVKLSIDHQHWDPSICSYNVSLSVNVLAYPHPVVRKQFPLLGISFSWLTYDILPH